MVILQEICICKENYKNNLYMGKNVLFVGYRT